MLVLHAVGQARRARSEFCGRSSFWTNGQVDGMFIFGTCVGDDERYRSVALPSIERVAEPDDVIRSVSGTSGIAAAYNALIAEARTTPACDALVLLHEDVEIVDDNFHPKLLKAIRALNVGVVGVVGAAGLTGLAWGSSRRRAGMVYETRGAIDFGTRSTDVDVVDGLFLAVAPAAFGRVVFDGAAFPGFHGYDLDYCLQARDAGLRVVVTDIELLHRTKTGYGHHDAYAAAEVALLEKWPQWIKPRRVPPRLAGLSSRARASLRRAAHTSLAEAASRASNLVRRTPRAQLLQSDAGSGATRRAGVEPHEAGGSRLVRCPACSGEVGPPIAPEGTPQILSCTSCGTGVTWPAPERDVESSGLFDEMYGASRLRRRAAWFHEAQSRLQWLQLHVPEGVLLELGPATGEFLSVASACGYSVWGVEASSWAAAEARKLGVDVVTGYLKDWRETYPGMLCDAVVMWHVLEHVAQPREFLRETADVLKRTGRLVVEVPNFASSQARIDGGGWEYAALQEHHFHFTPDGLTRLLGSAGFEPVEVLPFSTRVYEPLATWLNRRNRALLARAPWPSLDMLRVIAKRRPARGSGLAG